MPNTVDVGFNPQERKILQRIDRRFRRNSTTILIVLLIGILGGLSIAYWIIQGRQMAAPSEPEQIVVSTPIPSQPILNQIVIVLTPAGFAPSTAVIKPGTEIKFLNRSGIKTTIKSDSPDSKNLSSFGEANDSESFTIILNPAGIYNYQAGSGQKGVIKVQP